MPQEYFYEETRQPELEYMERPRSKDREKFCN